MRWSRKEGAEIIKIDKLVLDIFSKMSSIANAESLHDSLPVLERVFEAISRGHAFERYFVGSSTSRDSKKKEGLSN